MSGFGHPCSSELAQFVNQREYLRGRFPIASLRALNHAREVAHLGVARLCSDQPKNSSSLAAAVIKKRPTFGKIRGATPGALPDPRTQEYEDHLLHRPNRESPDFAKAMPREGLLFD